MHFVARNSTESAYNAHGYALRHDPLIIFRQPPTAISHGTPPTGHRRSSISHGTPPIGHRRSTSGGSAKHLNFNFINKTAENDTHSGERVNLLDIKINEDEEENVPTQEANQEHNCEFDGCQRITINVAGQRHETQLKTLNRLPSTLLGDHEKRKNHWDPSRNEYFFDRHRPSFTAILYYYQSGGRLKRPVEVPVDIFIEELEFYEMGNAVIDAFKLSEGFVLDDESSQIRPDNKLQRVIWETFEYPESSVIAKIVSALSVFFILTSVVTFCMETIPEFKKNECKNKTIYFENGTVSWQIKTNILDPLYLIETGCIAWFVFELIVRVISCPSKTLFIKALLNWIDLASIVPYFVFLVKFLIDDSCSSGSRILSILRVLRVVRIFKLSRFSVGLQILGKTLHCSMKELSMFVLFLTIGIVIFAGAIFYAEAQNPASFFISIPDAFWWAVISMTTVGYGDVYPVGLPGKVIGAMCVLSGLLAIALPVPVIVTNFNNIYRQTTGRGASI